MSVQRSEINEPRRQAIAAWRHGATRQATPPLAHQHSGTSARHRV